MNIQAVINSRYSIGLAVHLGRVLSPGIGYQFTDLVTGILGRQRRLRMVQSVRANQWVVSGCSLSPAALDQITRQTYRHVGRCLFDLYHNIGDPAAIQRMTQISPEFLAKIQQASSDKIGSLFATVHLSNFDLVGRALALHGMKMQVLSVPEPKGGYRKQNRLRSEAGMELTPFSISALRMATERLENGGVVLTGIDRPIADSKYPVQFFGKQATLPVAHVRLALKAKIPVTLVAAHTQPNGVYKLMVSDPIPMKPYSDLDKEITTNAEAVLRVAEDWIRCDPEQWAMFYPVWPDAVKELRGIS